MTVRPEADSSWIAFIEYGGIIWKQSSNSRFCLRSNILLIITGANAQPLFCGAP